MEIKSHEEWVSYFLKSYKEELVKPFPYVGVKKIRHESGDRYEGFIPDLDLFSSTIASHCGGVKKILSWSDEKLLEARGKLSDSFFEKYPKYRPLDPMITEESTPDLYAWLHLHEKMRTKLLEFFAQMLARSIDS